VTGHAAAKSATRACHGPARPGPGPGAGTIRFPDAKWNATRNSLKIPNAGARPVCAKQPSMQPRWAAGARAEGKATRRPKRAATGVVCRPLACQLRLEVNVHLSHDMPHLPRDAISPRRMRACARACVWWGVRGGGQHHDDKPHARPSLDHMPVHASPSHHSGQQPECPRDSERVRSHGTRVRTACACARPNKCVFTNVCVCLCLCVCVCVCVFVRVSGAPPTSMR
jgi:hypothetical protein